MNAGDLTTVILTRDEASRLGAALASLPAGARILVLDAESSDATVAIARAGGAEVIVRPWRGFVDARRFALAQVRTPWALMLDADERLDATLRAALAALAPPAGVDGYILRRTTLLAGVPIRACGWSAEPVLRLVRAAVARLDASPAAGGNAELHERWRVPGATRDLPGTLVHDSYPDAAAYVRKFARYTAIEAAGLRPSVVATLRAAVLALARFAWWYGVRGGWREGWRGALVCGGSALYPLAAQLRALV